MQESTKFNVPASLAGSLVGKYAGIVTAGALGITGYALIPIIIGHAIVGGITASMATNKLRELENQHNGVIKRYIYTLKKQINKLKSNGANKEMIQKKVKQLKTIEKLEKKV